MCGLTGGALMVEVLLTPIHYRDRKVLHVVWRDISERKRLEARQQKLLEELSRSNTELEQFASIASHDLQEPLRMVNSYVQLLARRYKGKLDASADEFIHYAVDGTRRMQQLIEDLLAYSRVGRSDGRRVRTDCRVVLEMVLWNLSLALEDQKAEVVVGPMPEVMADETQLTQLFQNLIGNALKFHSEASPKIQLAARKSEDGAAWVFAVQDNGIGIPPEARERVFEIFKRLHGRGKYPGSGLGLAICRRIVERHGGRIWVESHARAGLFVSDLRCRGAG